MRSRCKRVGQEMLLLCADSGAPLPLPTPLVLQPPPRTCDGHGRGCSLDGHGLEDQHLCDEVHQGHHKRQQRRSCNTTAATAQLLLAQAWHNGFCVQREATVVPLAPLLVHRGCPVVACGVISAGVIQPRPCSLTIDGRVGGVARTDEAQPTSERRPGGKQPPVEVIHCTR